VTTRAPSAQIVATGSYLPGAPIGNDRVAELAGEVPDEVLGSLDVRYRHWMVDPITGKHLDSNSGMAVSAGRQALERSGREVHDLDLLIVCTSSPDFIVPPVANLVQDALGLERCQVMEVRGATSGWVQSVDVARMRIEAGLNQCALVIGSEAMSSLLVPLLLERGKDSLRIRDRLLLYLFGDGAGAVVVAAGDGGGIRASASACLGGGKAPGMRVLGGGTNVALAEQTQASPWVQLKLDATESSRFIPYVFATGLNETLGSAGLRPADIDVCIVPEGNVPYLEEGMIRPGIDGAAWLAMRPRLFDILKDVGGTGAAGVPLALDRAATTGVLKRGATLLMLGMESVKWSYAGMVLDWTAG
jgi:3-oxoacyl-[acyl-carrier-protein] synthase-3